MIEFFCGHRLCSDCYLKYKSRTLICPVCKTVMNRRSSLYKDEYLCKLGKLVSTLCENFKEEYQYTGKLFIKIFELTFMYLQIVFHSQIVTTIMSLLKFCLQLCLQLWVVLTMFVK